MESVLTGQVQKTKEDYICFLFIVANFVVLQNPPCQRNLIYIYIYIIFLGRESFFSLRVRFPDDQDGYFSEKRRAPGGLC